MERHTECFENLTEHRGLPHLIGTSFVVTTAILQGNTLSPVVVVAFITGTALSTSGGAADGVGETRTRRSTGFRADLIVTVFRT